MKNYDFCFGCGFSCGVTQALRAANLQFASLPFDWTATPSFPRAARIAAADFAHWLDREDLELIDVRHSGINRRIYFNRRTGFGFVHDFSLFKSPDDAYAEVAAKYERRAVIQMQLHVRAEMHRPFRKPLARRHRHAPAARHWTRPGAYSRHASPGSRSTSSTSTSRRARRRRRWSRNVPASPWSAANTASTSRRHATC